MILPETANPETYNLKAWTRTLNPKPWTLLAALVGCDEQRFKTFLPPLRLRLRYPTVVASSLKHKKHDFMLAVIKKHVGTDDSVLKFGDQGSRAPVQGWGLLGCCPGFNLI